MLRFIKSGLYKLRDAVAKTGAVLGGKLRSLFSGKLDEEAIEKLERILYEADLGVAAAMELTEKVQKAHTADPSLEGDKLLEVLRNEILKMMTKGSEPLQEAANAPTVILIVGVNGNGKTTTVAKLCKMFRENDKSVLVAAADTFRAAATEQLAVWAERTGADIVKGAANSDPAAVVYDALAAAKSRGTDVVLIDTAGRLHTKTNLMQELEKIRRSSHKVLGEPPHETLLILDATTGQNAIDQAKVFHQHTPITGLVLTKLDGTAKGGIVVSIEKQLGIPIKFVGVGEGMDDLEPFDPETFVDALLS